MGVYIDNARNRYGRMVMCHMVADTREELLEMADRIGVDRKWLQYKPSVPWQEHFDVCLAKRQLAIEHGAIEVTRRELAGILRSKRNQHQRDHGA